MIRSIPDRIRTWPELTQWLADEFHGGTLYGIAKKLGVSSATIYFWRDGATRVPTAETIVRLAETYHLDRDQLLRMAVEAKMTTLRSGYVPPRRLPRPRSTSDKRRRGRRAALGLFLAASLGYGSLFPVVAHADLPSIKRYYVNRRRARPRGRPLPLVARALRLAA